MGQQLGRQHGADHFQFKLDRGTCFLILKKREREGIAARLAVLRHIHFHPDRVPDKRIGVEDLLHIIFQKIGEQTRFRAFKADLLFRFPHDHIPHPGCRHIDDPPETDVFFQRGVRHFQLHGTRDKSIAAIGKLETVFFPAQGRTFFQREGMDRFRIGKDFGERGNEAQIKHKSLLFNV